MKLQVLCSKLLLWSHYTPVTIKPVCSTVEDWITGLQQSPHRGTSPRAWVFLVWMECIQYWEICWETITCHHTQQETLTNTKISHKKNLVLCFVTIFPNSSDNTAGLSCHLLPKPSFKAWRSGSFNKFNMVSLWLRNVFLFAPSPICEVVQHFLLFKQYSVCRGCVCDC